MNKPWDDWIPGALCRQQVLGLINQGYVNNAVEKNVDHSALDLTLAGEGYVLPHGCIKPQEERYLHLLTKQGLAQQLSVSGDGIFTLEARHSYLFRLKESISRLANSPIWGHATAKSSVGRMDVLARLVVDGMDEYESFHPKRIQSGEMFLEITPMTFSVKVKEGISLVQLRLFKGRPEESRIHGEHLIKTVLITDGASNYEPTLSVDLRPDRISGNEACAFSVSRESVRGKSLPLWETPDQPRPWEYWRLDKADEHRRLRIENDRFYIIRSLERLRLPQGVAVYCRASDESIGEMRIHYAGFAHPFFGMNRTDDIRGTPLIFEVRGHDVNVNLQHGEKMARLEFYRMSEDCEKSTEVAIYDAQVLQLSKYFAKWPSRGVLDGAGFLSPLDR